jgi:hypothetical protein
MERTSLEDLETEQVSVLCIVGVCAIIQVLMAYIMTTLTTDLVLQTTSLGMSQ